MTTTLSGVTQPAVIAIASGRPLLSVEETNRILRQQGVALALAQGVVLDLVARSVMMQPDEENALMRAYLEGEGISSDEALEGWLRRKGWSLDDLRYFATKAERVRRYSHNSYGPEAEIRFLDRKLDLDQVTYSLMRVSDGDLAEELYCQLKEEGADFATLVAAHAEGSERVTRGLIGPVAISAGHPAVAEKLRVGSPGQLWPPFKVAELWLLVRLEQRFPAQLDQDMRSEMVNELFQIWFKEQVNLLMAGEPLMPLIPDLNATDR
ncbi:peptidylprolyl isomerase [Synechococcus sp. Cruz-9H2]|uniref:peptidylprolyl isomerase n=1 Tax=unclassified Synechococcus TaxID=2626047 RepID=UPI0020CC1CEF|nr:MULTISPECIES: peptidylprolyl isomerase [unclassified Synechococcus]MCP9818140.1 peptidylprolyl isomerase [Synechococcus sp. Cruz-9H2]MCP9842360.1 peptidylprolyl isomerase [Synechococcus sp. Edmonson 11F2]MCP9854536.1 peptidylprolyl isomerase [Synechococcus sp. Cruz-9C9]MCP9861768.1 peptidylprolyl isomerase [Synechococcus sp. Cruz-7E5]MCP9869048.1 peptidylprolyl isomerase [Synechococcus sp. Cruz-7B9]